MQVTDKPQRWKKGVFHKGEVKQYLEQMSHEEAEFLLMRKENTHAPELIRSIMILDFLGRTLRENKNKKVKIKRLAKRYSQERNQRIKRKIINIFRFNKTPKINNKSIENQANTDDKKPTYEELQKMIEGLLEKYGDDWKHQHRRNLDEARDITHD